MPTLVKGSVFRDPNHPQQRVWTVVRKLGEGQAAEVFAVKSDQAPHIQHAVKIEREPGAKALRGELKVLKTLQGSQHACQLFEHGTYNGHEYIIMELLGLNAFELRKAHAPSGRWSTRTVKQLGMAMLSGLHDMHTLGLIHRDVKPANFGVSPPGYHCSAGEDFEGTLKVIDFGLSKRYLDDAGNTIAQKEGKIGFRGSTVYASLFAHNEQELGRRDDLWSWLYVMVEMLDGGLCWRLEDKHDDKQKKKGLAMAKKQAAFNNPALLTAQVELPEGMVKISNYLASLGFADQPQYSLLEAYLEGIPDMHLPLKQSQPNGYPVDSSGPAAVGPHPPPLTRHSEGYPSTSSAQLDSTWQAQDYAQGNAGLHGQPPLYNYSSEGLYSQHQRPPGELAAFSQPQQQGPSWNGSWPYAQQQHAHQQAFLHAQAEYEPHQAHAAPIADTPLSPIDEHAISPSQARPGPESLSGPSPDSPPALPGSPPPTSHATNGIDLEALKRQAQLHMQRQLAKPDSADGSLHGTPSSRPGSASEVRHKSSRRESATDAGSRDAQHSHKRPRVAASALEHARADIGEGSHHQQQQQAGDTDADDAEAFDSVMQMVQQVHGNRISRAGRDAKDCLRSLDAAEGIGVIAWLVDGLLSQRTDARLQDVIKDWVTDLGVFIRRRTR